MQTQFKITCPECSDYIVVDGHWDDAEPDSNWGAYALIEQEVVVCPACEYQLTEADRRRIESRIAQFPTLFTASDW